jgi:hypothetical protein
MNSASTSSILAVYGMLPTYRRRPSLIAWGTCAPGRLKAAREVLGLGMGLALGLALVRDGVAGLSTFIRQLGELKARPSVRTFAKGDLVGAVYCRYCQSRLFSTLWGIFSGRSYSVAPPVWGSLYRPFFLRKDFSINVKIYSEQTV